MNLLGTTLSLMAALSAVVAAQQPRPTVSDAWRAFLRDQGGGWTAEWNPATGTPAAIYGKGMPLGEGRIASLERARSHASAILQRHAALLGTGASTLVEDIGQKVAGVYVFVYDQRFADLPVVDGRADVRVHEAGVVSMFGSQLLPIPADFDVRPALEAEQAVERALRHLDLPARAGSAGPATRLVIWGDADRAAPAPVRLAWEMSVDRFDAGKVGRAFVDAKTGRVLEYRSDLHRCFELCRHAAGRRHRAAQTPAPRPKVRVTERAPIPGSTNVRGNIQLWANTSNDAAGPLSRVPAENMRVQVVGGNAGFTDANGDFDIPHAGSQTVSVRFALVGRHIADVDPEQGTKFAGSARVTPGTPAKIRIYSRNAPEFDRAQSNTYWAVDDVNTFLRTIVGNTGQMKALDAMRATVNRARSCNAFYTNNTITFFASGRGCRNTAMESVIYHEWGHGLDDQYGGITQNEGLGEGWADAVTIYTANDPDMARNIFGPGRHGRTARNTRTYPPTGRSPQEQGEVWMGWAWDARRELMAKLGNAAGIAHANKIVLGSIVANARSQPAAAREVYILDDDDGNLLNGTPNDDALGRACAKRRMPCPKRDPAFYEVFGKGCKGTGKGSAVCGSNNAAGGTLPPVGPQNEIAAIEVAPAQAPRSVTGYELFTRALRGGSATIRTALYLSDAGGNAPRTTAARTGTMAVGATAGWYETKFTPITVPAGRKFWVEFGDPQAVFPTVQGGRVNTHFFRPRGAPRWFGPFDMAPWTYKVKCGGGGNNAVPVLAGNGLPELGRSMSLVLSLARRNASAALLVGVSRQRWGPFNLPLDLAAAGAPGCSVLVSGEGSLSLRTSGTGAGSVKLTIPNAAGLVGKEFFNQFVVLDGPANALGVALTNAGKGRVGRP